MNTFLKRKNLYQLYQSSGCINKLSCINMHMYQSIFYIFVSETNPNDTRTSECKWYNYITLYVSNSFCILCIVNEYKWYKIKWIQVTQHVLACMYQIQHVSITLYLLIQRIFIEYILYVTSFLSTPKITFLK